MSEKKCLIEGCESKVVCRGLCWACYQGARRRVNQGEVSWGQLVDWGLALKKNRPGAGQSAFAKALERKRSGAGTAKQPAPDTGRTTSPPVPSGPAGYLPPPDCPGDYYPPVPAPRSPQPEEAPEQALAPIPPEPSDKLPPWQKPDGELRCTPAVEQPRRWAPPKPGEE